jgi:hypothetical protein
MQATLPYVGATRQQTLDAYPIPGPRPAKALLTGMLFEDAAEDPECYIAMDVRTQDGRMSVQAVDCLGEPLTMALAAREILYVYQADAAA